MKAVTKEEIQNEIKEIEELICKFKNDKTEIKKLKITLENLQEELQTYEKGEKNGIRKSW